jgi:hypothetical protein
MLTWCAIGDVCSSIDQSSVELEPTNVSGTDDDLKSTGNYTIFDLEL